MRLDFAIIGAQKAATTTLHRTLQQSSQIAMPEGETATFEYPYFTPDALDALYSELAALAEAAKLVGLRRPNYLTLPEVPARLYAVAPSVKVIAVLREPAKRAVSAYFHHMNHGSIPVRPAEEVFGELLSGRWDSRFPRYAEVLAFSTYAPAISRWDKTLGERSTLWVDQVDLLLQPQQVLGQVWDHIGGCGRPPTPSVKNSNEGHYSTKRLRAIRPFIDLTLGRDATRHLVRVRRHRLHRAIRRVDERILTRLFNSPSAEDVLSNIMWSRLREYFAADVAAVRELVGIDLTRGV